MTQFWTSSSDSKIKSLQRHFKIWEHWNVTVFQSSEYHRCWNTYICAFGQKLL